MSRTVVLVAPISESVQHSWFSPGRAAKLSLVKQFLADYGEVCALNTSPDCSIDSFESIPISRPSSGLLLRFIDALRFNYRGLSACDFIWVYNPRFYEFIVVFMIRLRFPRAPIVLQIEDHVGARAQNSGLRALFDCLSFFYYLYFSSLITCVSPSVFRAVYRVRPHGLPGLVLFPPVLNTHFLEVSSRRLPPFSSSSIKIMYAGGYSKEKGVSTLVSSFALLPPNYFLHLAGPIDEASRQSYSEISQNIVIHGHLTREDLAELYSYSDIVVNPHLPIASNESVFPFKSIEQVASGSLPCLSSCMRSDVYWLPDECFFSTSHELYLLLLNSSDIWSRNSARLTAQAERFRNAYSPEGVFSSLDSAFKSIYSNDRVDPDSKVRI